MQAGGDNGTPPPDQSGNAQPPSADTITLLCRAVDLSGPLAGIDSAADNEIVYSVERQLKATPEFDPKSIQTSSQISPVDARGTFTFMVTLAPQTPLKLQ